MKGLFDLIADYYLWILLALAVIFFAYIGYSAEKKGYIGKKKKKEDDTLVDIDELIKPKEEKTSVQEEHEEDLSASFDVMPEFTKPKEEPKVEEDISEDLYAPFGDQNVEEAKSSSSVDEVVEDSFNQDFVDVAKIEAEAKDIHNTEDKKDVADLMKSDGQVSMDFEVEGATADAPTDNIFDKVAAEDKKEKKEKEEVVDDMWKF